VAAPRGSYGIAKCFCSISKRWLLCCVDTNDHNVCMHAMQMGNRGASDAAQVDGSARCVRCFLLQLSIYQTPYGHKNKQINKSHERDIPNMV
jgi:hypothetical protein